MARRSLLVVDDDDSTREVTRVSLEVTAGWAVRTAASGPDALAAVAQERPDAVLLDVMMPGMDGLATVERLQADATTRAVAVILLTAKAQAGERAELAALPGVAGVIAKPFDPMTLAATVASTLRWTE